jgi:hypothetical protein
VADSWLTDGQDAYHVRVYAPHEEWVDSAIHELVYNGLSFKSRDMGE